MQTATILNANGKVEVNKILPQHSVSLALFQGTALPARAWVQLRPTQSGAGSRKVSYFFFIGIAGRAVSVVAVAIINGVLGF